MAGSFEDSARKGNQTRSVQILGPPSFWDDDLYDQSQVDGEKQSYHLSTILKSHPSEGQDSSVIELMQVLARANGLAAYSTGRETAFISLFCAASTVPPSNVARTDVRRRKAKSTWESREGDERSE